MDMTKQLQRRIARVVRVLRSHNWNTRQDVLEALDVNADYTAIKGIGKRLGPVLEALMLMEDSVFTEVTGMYCYSWQETNHPATHGDLGTGKMSTHDPE